MLIPSIIIIEPISSGLGLIKAAKALGILAIILTANSNDRSLPKEIRESKGKEVIVHEVDTYNVEQMHKTALRLQQEFDIIGVVPGFEYFVPKAALLAQALNLPSLPADSVMALRDKDKMKEMLEESHVELTKWMKTNLGEMKEIAAGKKIIPLKFPIVAKPNNLSGSMGVQKLYNLEDLGMYVTNISKHMPIDLDKVPDMFLLEEYIQGPEMSVEGYISSSGKINIVSITEKILGPEPYFVEVGHVVSPENFKEHREKIIQYLKSVVHALKITRGPFHAEIRLRDHQTPILIEIGARLPGDHICDVIKHATGVDLPKIMIQSFSKETFVEEPIDFKTHPHAVFFLQGQKGHAVKEITLEQFTQKFPKIQHIFWEAAKPGEIVSSNDDFMSRIFGYLVQGSSVKELKDLKSQVENYYKSL